jgi:hypothetical protein
MSGRVGSGRADDLVQGCEFTSPKLHLGEGEVKVTSFSIKFSKNNLHPFSPLGVKAPQMESTDIRGFNHFFVFLVPKNNFWYTRFNFKICNFSGFFSIFPDFRTFLSDFASILSSLKSG